VLLEVNRMAPAQRSLAGTGSVIQILNVRAEFMFGEFGSVYTRT